MNLVVFEIPTLPSKLYLKTRENFEWTNPSISFTDIKMSVPHYLNKSAVIWCSNWLWIEWITQNYISEKIVKLHSNEIYRLPGKIWFANLRHSSCHWYYCVMRLVLFMTCQVVFDIPDQWTGNQRSSQFGCVGFHLMRKCYFVLHVTASNQSIVLRIISRRSCI